MEPRWYVLRSKPRKEELLWRHATDQGFEIFYPRIPVQRVNPRARKVAAYFPGYMFVHVDLDDVGTSTFEWMPHAIGLVSFGEQPPHVAPELIERIRRRIERIGAVGGETFLKLRQGDRVEITHGPFAGYEAIFDTRLSGEDRVRVLLDMLNDRTVPVELRVSELRRVA
jgi:transcriptional antiterminator RfaH